MAKEKPSLADLLRNHINQKLSENFDYSLAINRKQDIQFFINANKSNIDKKSTAITIRPSHTRLLEECMKNKGIDIAVLGKKTHAPKFSGDLNAVITPMPQAGKVDLAPKSKAPVTTTVSPTGGIGIVTPQGVIVQQAPQIFDEKSVSATLNAIFLMFRFSYPDLELLTNEEKDSLGKVWLPAFNKYLTENWALIGVPLFATTGIFLPKLIEARKKKKLRESKGEAGAKQEEIDSKLQTRAEQIKTDQEKKIEASVKQNEALPKTVPKIGVPSINIPEEKKEQ